jgi:hypothetical protein
MVVCLALGGMPLLAQTTPGDERPAPDTYLDELQRHLAIEYGSSPEVLPDTILAGLQRHLEIEYGGAAVSAAMPDTILAGLQRHLEIEYGGAA